MKAMLKTMLGDITKIDDVDAIVNAANTSLLGGGGVDGAIHRAAGKELLFECRMLNGCKIGQAKITKGYQLACKHIIHTVGPVWNGGGKQEAKLLADCYRNSLQAAMEHGIRTVAFPSIATGIYRFPVERAAMIAVDTVSEVLRKHADAFELVVWVLFDENTLAAYEMAVRQTPVNYGIFPVEDVFEIKGRGVVATGKVESGTFHREDTVKIMRDGKKISTSIVKGIEIFGHIPYAMRGDNVGLLLAGITKADVCTGDIIMREVK